MFHHFLRCGQRERSVAMLLAAGVLFMASMAVAAPPKPMTPKIPLENARCPVTNGKASEKFETEYKGAKLFFADADALATFQGAKNRYIDRANLQLVATKQYHQTACPLTGRPFSKNFGVSIEGVPIHVCCKNCVLMSAKAKLADQLKFFFGDEVFDRQYRRTPPEANTPR